MSTASFPHRCQVFGYQEGLLTPDLIFSLSPYVPRKTASPSHLSPFPTLFFCLIRGHGGKYHLSIFYYHHNVSLRCRGAFLGDISGSCLIPHSKSHTTSTTTCLGSHPVHAALRGHCPWGSSPYCGTPHWLRRCVEDSCWLGVPPKDSLLTDNSTLVHIL